MSAPVEKVLQTIRSRIPANIFNILETPLRQELLQTLESAPEDNPYEVLTDAVSALGDIFTEPVDDKDLEPLKALLMNAALLGSEPNDELIEAIKNMTLDGVKEKNPVTGCVQDPVVAALYAVCTMYPLKNEVHRLNSITDAFNDAAQEIYHLTN